MPQYAFHVDTSMCTGCKTCQVACQDKNDLRAILNWRRVYEYGGGSWSFDDAGCAIPEGVFRYFVSAACNHCTDPACVRVCPTGAMQKDEETGIVWTDHDICIGCGSCIMACPYKAPVLDEVNGYATKCDMCKDQVENGDLPECVKACPQRVLDFGTVDEILMKYPNSVDGIEPLPVAVTGPNSLLTPHPRAQLSGESTGMVMNMEEEY